MSHRQNQRSRRSVRASATIITVASLTGALCMVLVVGAAQAAKDQGITSATHRKNVKRIRFSTMPIAF